MRYKATAARIRAATGNPTGSATDYEEAIRYLKRLDVRFREPRTYGAELMTPREREAYRRDLDAAASDDARERFRERHRERLRERARERGATLDDRGIVERRGSGSRARDAEGKR